MDVLLYLCRYNGEVLSAEQLLESCWGTTQFGINQVHKVIAQLRKALGDSSATPRYIETIHKRGYRVLIAVEQDDGAVAGSWLHDSPFRGLHAYDERHAAVFFGRKLATAQLLQVVAVQAASGCALVLVLGPSGSGKTSLVRAGVLPQLGLANHLYFDVADAGEGDLLQALASVLLDAETARGQVFENDSADSLGWRLRHAGAALVAQLEGALAGARLGLFVDRFEAIFPLPHIDDAHRAAFIAALELLARSGSVTVICACRNDFYPYVAAYPSLIELKRRGGHYDLRPPDQAEIGQIIRQPALAARLRFGAEADGGMPLDEVLCAEARARPDMLPLLQYCLQELYRQRGPDGELSFAVFRALGGIEGAMGARAEQVTQALSAQHVAALPRVLSHVVSLSEDDLPVTSRHVPWAALSQAADLELVRALVEARLFVSDLDAGVPTFGIAHDALLRRWPRVAAWIERHRSALQLRTRISAQASRWQSSGRSRELLLPRGAQANQARELLLLPGFQLTSQDRDFIDATLRLAKRGERRRVAVLAALTFLALLVSVLALMAYAARQRADRQRVEAEGLMGFMLGDFVDKVRPLGRLDLLDSISARALSYLAATKSEEGDSVALGQRAQALQVLAEVKIARADPAGATQVLLVAHQILQAQWRKTPFDRPLLKTMGANAFWLGQMQLDQLNWPGAARYFNEYLTLSDRSAALAPDDVDGWIEQSYAHSNLGTVALKRGAIARAADEFAASIALKTRALTRSPSNQNLSADLANSFSWLASAREMLGQLADAMALYQRGAELMRALHAAVPSNAQWTLRYAFSLWHQAELHLVLGDSVQAGVDFHQADALLLSIVKEDTSNRAWQSALYTVQLKLIDLQNGGAIEKIAALQVLQAKLAVLISLEPKKWYLQRLSAMADERCARLYWGAGRESEARQHLASALGVLRRLHTSAPTDPLIPQTLAGVLLLQAEFDRVQGNKQGVADACHAAQRLLDVSVAASADFHILAPWVLAARCNGNNAAAAPAVALLSKMHYQEPVYTRAMARNPTSKE